MRNAMLLEWAVGRGPEGDDVQRSAGEVPARKWCLWHRRDSHRLAPLEKNVNDQNAPLLLSSVSQSDSDGKSCDLEGYSASIAPFVEIYDWNWKTCLWKPAELIREPARD